MYCCDVAAARLSIPAMPQMKVNPTTIKVVFLQLLIVFVAAGGPSPVSCSLGELLVALQLKLNGHICNFYENKTKTIVIRTFILLFICQFTDFIIQINIKTNFPR
jgi:hypothetical protein